MKNQIRLKKSVKYCAIGFLVGFMIGVFGTLIMTPKTEIPIEAEAKTDVPTYEFIIETTRKINIGTFELTAYCPCYDCCKKRPTDKGYGITKSGTKATENRTIAVDPKIIPLGSTVEINGQRYTAEDIGGAVKNNRIDIFFNSHQDALKFGRQTATVYLIESE